MKRALALLALLLLGAAAVDAPKHRAVGRTLSAGVGPVRELRFADEFSYVGGQRFVLKKVADAEQHFFVVASKDRSVRRLYWVQFEQLLPGFGEAYDYSSDEEVDIAGVSFRRNTRRWDAPPEPESDRAAVTAFLAKHGYRIPPRAVRVRLVHVPAANPREELMIIYAEAPERRASTPESDVQRRALEGLKVLAMPRSDADVLLAHHEEVLRAHRESDVERLLAAEPDDYVVANRGEITKPDRKARRERLGPYLRQTTFSTYRDKVPPIVRVSADGSLGWVIVQVEAKGEQRTPEGVQPIEFVSAWIELYEKRNGRWLRVGNVSNFKPPAGTSR